MLIFFSSFEYKYTHVYARDFRDLVAYKAFSSDYIAVPLLDRESPYVSHCARARIMENARFWISNERERGKVGVYGHVSMNFFFSKAIRGRKIESSRYIHDSLRSSIDVSGHHRVSIGEHLLRQKLSALVYRLPFSPLTVCSFHGALVSFTHALIVAAG